MTTSFDEELGFDPEEIRSRYEIERRKRLRTDANEQYQQISGEFAHYDDDPHADPNFIRDPIDTDIEFLLIGGGFGSLITAARLRDAGVEDIHVIDKAADFGGTWYWNRYPGVQCDIEAYVYMPLLERTGFTPARKYAYGSEIREHAQAIARKLDLYRDALFQTAVTGMEWNEDTQRWDVSTDRGDRLSARFVAMATGPLNRPKLPAIPGITTFTGHTFHTSRWDYAYTGGNEKGGLEGLRGLRVAVIGTGSTGVQCIPHVADTAEHLYVVQRTPAAVDVRGDRPTDIEWFRSQSEGWQEERINNFTAIIDGSGADTDMVNDGWTAMYQDLTAMPAVAEAHTQGAELDRSERAKLKALADMRTMERIRKRISDTVDDPEIAEKLKPWYGRWCKRPQFHDNYYPVFNKPNVTLVDTDGQGVEKFTEHGFVVDGTEYEVDCIIFATGFEVGTDYTRRSQYDVKGRGGITLSEKWAEGLRTFQGMFTSDFPNCFFLGQTQTGLTANYCHTVDQQAQHLAYVIEQVRERKAVTVEPTHDAECAFVEHFNSVGIGNSSYYQSCTPGFFTNEGDLAGNKKGFLSSFYGRGPLAFFELLAEWRSHDALQGLTLDETPPGEPSNTNADCIQERNVRAESDPDDRRVVTG